MADIDRQGSSLFYPGLIAVFLAMLGSHFYSSGDLDSSRPAAREPSIASFGRMQKADARLWQDPFAGLGKTAKDASLLTSYAKIREAYRKSETDVLAIMVSGARYAGAAEERRRTRHAVLSALHTSGYVPDDPHRIGVAGDRRNPSLWIPFETYGPSKVESPKEASRNGNDRKPVLVFWFNEDVLDEKPLAGLHRSLCEILGGPAREACSRPQMELHVQARRRPRGHGKLHAGGAGVVGER